MFTGIVACIGHIVAIDPLGNQPEAGVRLQIDAGALSLDDVALGDSIAINGACMTVIHKSASTFAVEVSRESLQHTVGLAECGPVNLEKALRLSDRLGGHLVSGHVDGIGHVRCFSQVGESWQLVIQAPGSFAKYLAFKGSIVVNGVSLTVNRVDDQAEGCAFSINLIPHTVETTTLKNLTVDMAVNLEIDLIARYVDRMLSLKPT